MKALIIHLTITALIIISTASPSIGFKPFTLNFKTPFTAMAILCLVLAYIFIHYEAYKQGLKAGQEVTMEAFKEYINDGILKIK